MNVNLTTFLRNIGLPRLIKLFQTNEITQVDMLNDLTDADLDTIGLKMGERMKLKKSLQSMTTEPDYSSELEDLTKLLFGDGGFKYIGTTEQSTGILDQFQNFLSKTSTEDEWGSLILNQMLEKDTKTQINFKDLLIGFLEASPEHQSLFFISNFYKDGKALPLICPSFKGKDICMIKNFYVPFNNQRKPIVLSLKTNSVQGASSLLNEVFHTTFEEEKGPFHHSADISFDTELINKGYHIIDVHQGVNDLGGRTEALLKISSFVILHAKESDFEKSKAKPELQKIYDKLTQEKISFVTLIRDRSGKSTIETAGDSFGVGNTSNKNQRAIIIKRVSEFLKPKIREMLTDKGNEKSFQQIQKILCDNAFDFEVIPLEERFIDFMETVQELLKFKNQKVKLSKIFEFTHSKNPQKFHPLVKKFYDSIVNESKDLSLYVFIFCNLLSRWNDEITKKPKMELKKAKQEYEDLKSKKSDVKAVEKLIKDLTEELTNVDISIDHFWREYSYFSQRSLHVNDQNQTINLFQRLFMEGIPLEIINGDNFSLSYPFLSKVLKILQNKKFSTISIIGPQSSGKSTLLNFLYGSSFPVSSGRCTKGLYASFVKSKDGKDVMILDSEGLFSVEKGSKEYDRKIVLLALAASHKTMMNIKGELGTHIQEIMEICLYTLQSLRIGTRRPVLHFVLRDITEQFTDGLNQQKSSILDSFDKVGKDFNFDWRKIVGFSTDNFQNMNSAFNNEQKTICGENFCITKLNALFNSDCQELGKKLIVDNGSEFVIDEWLNIFKSAWHCVQHYKDLDNLNAISDYMKQLDLNAAVDEELQKYREQLLSWGDNFQLNETLSTEENEKKFMKEAKNKILEFGFELEKEFNKKGLEKIARSEISSKAKHYLNRVCDNMTKVWTQNMSSNVADEMIDSLQKDLRTWIDKTDFSDLSEKKIKQIKKNSELEINKAESEFETKMREIFTQNLNFEEIIPEIFKTYSEKYAKERGVVAFALLGSMDFRSTSKIKFDSIFENHLNIDYPKKFRYAKETKGNISQLDYSIEKLDQCVIERFKNEIQDLCRGRKSHKFNLMIWNPSKNSSWMCLKNATNTTTKQSMRLMLKLMTVLSFYCSNIFKIVSLHGYANNKIMNINVGNQSFFLPFTKIENIFPIF
jgi:energy-coupling factor transporter ATP-binding protein EcfA2